MTDPLRAAADTVADRLRAIPSPEERYEATRAARRNLREIDATLRVIEGEIARDLHAAGLSWEEVGQRMGGVRRQRAQQIAAAARPAEEE